MVCIIKWFFKWFTLNSCNLLKIFWKMYINYFSVFCIPVVSYRCLYFSYIKINVVPIFQYNNVGTYFEKIPWQFKKKSKSRK